MSDNRFRNGHYEDAIQYTKDVLRHSCSIEEIENTLTKDYKEKNNDKNEKDYIIL